MFRENYRVNRRKWILAIDSGRLQRDFGIFRQNCGGTSKSILFEIQSLFVDIDTYTVQGDEHDCGDDHAAA